MNYNYDENNFTAHEFLESWEKELYQLTNLDLFAFRIINGIVPKIEYYLRTNCPSEANISLTEFNDISHFCFNLGDAYAHFLERNCFATCPIKCPRNFSERLKEIPPMLPGKIARNIEALVAISDEMPDKEQIFRFEILDQVILQSIYQYYSEFQQTELDDDDISVLEFAEYIEDAIMEITLQESNRLLLRPFENAMDQFESLLANEIAQSNSRNLKRGEAGWEEESPWQKQMISPHEMFQHFDEEMKFRNDQSGMELTHDLHYFKKFVYKEKKLQNIQEIDSSLLKEFFAVFLVHEFILNYHQQLPYIFNAMARICTFIENRYHLFLKKKFLEIYNAVKTDLPRVIACYNDFLNNLNLTDTLFGEKEVLQHGVYEVRRSETGEIHLVELISLHTGHAIKPVIIDAKLGRYIHSGDIFRCALNFRRNHWQIVELQGIYPALAKEFLAE